ncbi:MAG: hydrogen gas-evolving membrane-bound hydrogenase subunit E, partial [Verrucomicrobiota bacterium]
AATAILLAIEFVYRGGLLEALALPQARLHEWVLVSLMATAAVIATLTKSRLKALLSLGIVGFGVALIFMFYSAPDLAITQVLVETLTIVLFMLVVYRLPRFRIYSSGMQRIADGVFSLIVGGIITTLILKAQQLQLSSSISETFGELSYAAAKGKNVVNVILVDFRALDTFAEITVLGIAALGVIALVSRRFNRTNERST